MCEHNTLENRKKIRKMFKTAKSTLQNLNEIQDILVNGIFIETEFYISKIDLKLRHRFSSRFLAL